MPAAILTKLGLCIAFCDGSVIDGGNSSEISGARVIPVRKMFTLHSRRFPRRCACYIRLVVQLLGDLLPCGSLRPDRRCCREAVTHENTASFLQGLRTGFDRTYFFLCSPRLVKVLPFVKSAVATTFSFTFLGFFVSLLPRFLSPLDTSDPPDPDFCF